MHRHALFLTLMLAAPVLAQTPPDAPVSEPVAPETVPAPISPAPSTTGQPVTVVFTETVPSVIDGQKTYVPYVQTFALGESRTAQLRAGGGKLPADLRAGLSTFLRNLDHGAVNARFEYDTNAGRWQIAMQSSVKVDVNATFAAIEAALRDPAKGRVNVVYASAAPTRTLDYFLSRGITNFLGEGVTNYAGSSAARIKNIQVGAAKFKDRLFQGDTFSFNAFVGPITTGNGFVTGRVISGERTADGIGGGICQVSTTAFRTLFSAGLPIVQRKPHSYQVSYYAPTGLDATIYQPSLDLKFRNDTGGAIWFQTFWDEATSDLVIQAFGRPRAETVEIGEPRVLSTTPSPRAKLIVDKSLARGQRQQVDWAAPGATVEVERRFVKDGQVVRRETLKSVYRPWPDIFLVGPS